MTSPQYWWYLFVLAGSIVSILINTFKVFGFGTEWEERKTKEIYEKDQNKKWQ